MQNARRRRALQTTQPPASAALPVAAWYDDPASPSLLRWWSGTEWTEYRCPRPGGIPLPAASGGASTAQPTPNRSPIPNSTRPSDLRGRIPAQSLMEQLTRLQAEGGFELSRDGHRLRLPEHARSWYTGAIGERRVAAVLDQLGPEWTVLHSVPVGMDGSDIDHVLIGPPGVYTLNTKHHPGKTVWVAGHGMMIDGQRVPYLRNSAFEARRPAKLLTAASGITVQAAGVVVLVGVTSLTVRAKPDGGDVVIGVVRDRDLLAALRVRRAYSDEQVRRIADAAVRPETWSALALPAADTAAMLTNIDDLVNKVNAADTRDRRLGAFTGFTSAPATRSSPRARSGSRSSRRRTSSPLASLLQLAGLLVAAYIAYNVLIHH